MPTNRAITRALDIPEILLRIGSFIPLWDGRSFPDSSPYPTLEPKTLISCILVSKLWHQAFLPFLWCHYDSDYMQGLISEETLRQYGVLFRTMRVLDRDSLISLGCVVNLIELTIRQTRSGPPKGGPPGPLVRLNPQLQKLDWCGESPFRVLDVQDFNLLTNLRCLRLSYWKCTEGQLARLLRTLAGSLRELELGLMRIIPTEELNSTPQSSPLPSAIEAIDNHDEVRTEAGQQQTAGDDNWELPHLESIATWITSCVHFTDLIKRCPNLKTLTVSLHTSQDTPSLADGIRIYCPRLESLHFHNFMPSHPTDVLVRNCSTTGLRKLELDARGTEDDDLVSAILQHAATLEDLKVVRSCGEIDVPCYLRLLVGCEFLKVFSLLMGSGSTTLSHDFFETLKGQHWGCRRTLEQLEFGLEACSEVEEDPADIRMMQELSSITPVLGWYISQQEQEQEQEQEVDISSMSKTKLRQAFEMTQGLESLKTMILDDVEFRR
ncbi:hypothetical protein BGX23_010826 [Mortierella sp. AD031]|nr:hypothetical protein BGX23_010826 [Mortierella sp. AD031]